MPQFWFEPKDIEGCQCFPVSRNSRISNKREIIKFANRKHPEALLRKKNATSSKDFSYFNIHEKLFVSVSVCPNSWYIWGKHKDVQRRGKIQQVFCQGGSVAVKVTKPSNAKKMFHECYILDSYSVDIWRRLDLVFFRK